MGLLDPDEASSLDPVDAEAWEQILSRDDRPVRELIANGDEEARLLREQLRALYSAEEMRQVLANLGANTVSDLTFAQARQLAIVGELRNRAIDPPAPEPERVEQEDEYADIEWEDDDA
jgi:hypothetical protein